MPKGVKGFQLNHTTAKDTRIKIGDALRKIYWFYCDYCCQRIFTRPSHYKRKKRHYCSMECYSKDRRENWKPEDQPTWTGGVSNTETHRRWKKKNPERMAHLKARRYARKKNAEGFHTFEEWQELLKKYGWKCAHCGAENDITKDHIIPLSENGTDYIDNIQPLCRSCNSKKWKHIYENPELLKG